MLDNTEEFFCDAYATLLISKRHQLPIELFEQARKETTIIKPNTISAYHFKDITDKLSSIGLDNMSNEKLDLVLNHIKNLAIDNSIEILNTIENKIIKKEVFDILKSLNIKGNIDVLKNNDLIVDYPNKVVFNMQQIRNKINHRINKKRNC